MFGKLCHFHLFLFFRFYREFFFFLFFRKTKKKHTQTFHFFEVKRNERIAIPQLSIKSVLFSRSGLFLLLAHFRPEKITVVFGLFFVTLVHFVELNTQQYQNVASRIDFASFGMNLLSIYLISLLFSALSFCLYVPIELRSVLLSFFSPSEHYFFSSLFESNALYLSQFRCRLSFCVCQIFLCFSFSFLPEKRLSIVEWEHDNFAIFFLFVCDTANISFCYQFQVLDDHL